MANTKPGGSFFDDISDFFQDLQKGMGMSQSPASVAKDKKVPFTIVNKKHLRSLPLLIVWNFIAGRNGLLFLLRAGLDKVSDHRKK